MFWGHVNDLWLKAFAMKAGAIIRDERRKLAWSQKDLADRIGVSQVAIMKIERGETVKSKFFPKIAEVLGIDLALLDPTLSKGSTPPVTTRSGAMEGRPLQVFPNEQLRTRHDLPVFSTAQGGTGALVLSNQPFREIIRPQNLVGINDAFGVLIVGNSMAREYREGDIAYVDPHLPPRVGDACLFQSEKDGTVEAVIKYLEKPAEVSAEVWHVSQSNPEKKFTLKKSDWQTCFVLVGKQAGR